MADAGQPAFTGPEQIGSDTGYVQLQWGGSDDQVVMLEQHADNGTVRTVYKGPNTGYFVSGLPDGTYHFRLVDPATGAAMDSMTVTVAHPPLGRALVLLAIGGLVSLATIAVIAAGSRNGAAGHG